MINVFSDYNKRLRDAEMKVLQLQKENNQLINDNDYLHETVESLYDEMNEEYDEWDW